jgi:hypothetical protein
LAFIKKFTDLSLIEHKASFWYPSKIVIDYNTSTIIVTYLGYKDAEALAANAENLSGAVREYIFRGNNFKELLQSLASKKFTGLQKALDDVVLSIKDNSVLDNRNKPVIDEHGNPVFESFFKDSQQTLPDIT